MPTFILSLVCLLAVDQGLKSMARQRGSVEDKGFVYRENPSGAMGGVSPQVSGLMLVATGALLIALLATSDWPTLGAAGLGAAMGGAASNFLDQAQHGFVIDYLAAPRGPAVNLADVAITVGLALGVVGLFV